MLGGDTAVLGDLGGPYTIDDPFREPLTMFSYLAGFTNLGFATSILIGPQRQTALLAKQAAEVDLLCGGRFRLGLGVGWNKLEYDALGMPFEQRGAILEEQVAVLRALWTREERDLRRAFHHIDGPGLAPLPVQRPIPIWIGAFEPPALRRVGRLADGWFPMVAPAGRPRGGARGHPRRRGRGGRATCPTSSSRAARILRPRPRQARRARAALARGRAPPTSRSTRCTRT